MTNTPTPDDKAGEVATPDLTESGMERNTTRFKERYSEYYGFGCTFRASEGQFSAVMCDLDALQARLTHLQQELYDAREAMAKYLGERNELQNMLILCGEDEAVQQKEPVAK